MNSSFSPPPSRMWDCRLHSDGLSHGPHGVHDTSLSSNSRGSRSWLGSERCTNHHHSISDGVLSYSDSLPDNVQQPQWTPPVQNFNPCKLQASEAGGSTTQATWFSFSTERQFAGRSPSFGSPSSLSGFSNLGSTSKRPFAFSSHNFSSQRPYVSKAVYLLVFHNCASDCETFDDAEINSFGGLTAESSPEPSASSRTDGFRWSNASSYDLSFDGERFDLAEHLDAESLRSPGGPAFDPKCEVCGKLLRQKSPWSSHRIMRGGDMPFAGVLACRHVFHAECLEQATPKFHICDPPCPLCVKKVGVIEESPSVPEPLQMALRSICKNRGVVISDALGSHSDNGAPSNLRDRLKRNWHRAVHQQNSSSLSITNRLKGHLTFRSKVGKDMLCVKMFHNIGSSGNICSLYEHSLSGSVVQSTGGTRKISQNFHVILLSA